MKDITLFKVRMAPNVATALAPVLQSGYIGQGVKVDEFEREFTMEYAPYPIVTTNACTAAIHMILMHLGIGPGDEVITTPLTCIATNAPILAVGARLIWADVDDETGNIDPDDVGRKVTKWTKAIIAVDWTGRPANYPALRAFGFPVIEDAAHGPLVEHAVTGDYVCYSFGPIKHMTCGDGGAVGTPDPEARASLALLRWYGLDRTSQKDFRCEQNIQKAGMKFHMNDINATIGLTNLPFLRETVAAHRRNARALYDGIIALHLEWLWQAPFSPESNYWVFPVLTANPIIRERLKKHLAQCGIGASQVHARNDHHAAYSFPNGPLPGLEMFDARHLNLPCGWWVRDDDITRILEALDEFVA